ncbi:MAG: hypothetical protein IKN46_04270 [Acholeplasmatales bacterium]|nr:hypothetical protein [Acholeplasmatales bacterium]
MEDKKEVKNEIKNETIETSGFVLSIVSIVTFFVFGLGILPGIVSLTLSILSYKKNKSDKAKLSIKLSIIGIVLSVLVLTTVIITLIFFPKNN